MDGRRFDALARQLAAAGTSRRRFLRTLGGGLVAGIGLAAGTGGADAVICRAGGTLCTRDGQCCAGTCDPDTHRCGCFDGEILCRGRCIPACTALDECHVTGECDPSYGVCTNPPADAGTTCGQGPRCADGVANAQDTCDGSGTCATGAQTDCGDYVCGATACLTTCGDDGACIEDYFCAGSQCLPKLPAGTSCTASNQCHTGFCVDGVCCDSACTDQCAACNLPGQSGTCSPVTGAPVGSRPACASDGSVCGGACDGTDTASCAYPGDDTNCRAASCSDGTETFAASCDGAGACPAAQTQGCGSYICGTDACLSSCTDDTQCIDAAYCDTGTHTCKQDLANGQPCSRAHQCTSGNCVDGSCCDSACTDQCAACNLPGHAGTCSPVTGAPVGGRAACASDGSVCGGTCDGVDTASCAYPGDDTSCRAAACSAGQQTSAAVCTGSGACPAPETKVCSPYICGSTACKTTCVGDGDCISSYYCSGSQCVTKHGQGATCTAANQCLSGNCADGVCCDSVCTGQCAACNLTGHVGTCSPVTGAPVGGRAACTSDGSVCGGSCNGTNSTTCTYPGAETTCRAASCSGGHQTNAATCTGTGACPAATGKDCTPYVCGATACLTSCTTDGSCISGDYCDGTHCQTKKANGGTCASNHECQNGHCAGGICCDSACTDPCHTCATGTCASTCTGGKICQSNTCVCPSGQTDCSGTCSSLNTTDHCGACGTVCPSPCGPYEYPGCYADVDGSHHFCAAGGFCAPCPNGINSCYACKKDSDCGSGYRCAGGQTPTEGCPYTTFCAATC